MKVVPLPVNETTLIKKAKQQQAVAQQQLFDRYAPKMLSVCRYYIKDIQQAEATMLDGFFKAFSNIKGFRFEGSFEGWLRRIMVREAISFLRQKKDFEILTDIPESYETPVYEQELLFEASFLQECIDALPKGYRTVFVMYVIEGYKHRDIAQYLDISISTSKSQLSRARKLLRKQLTKNKTSYVDK